MSTQPIPEQNRPQAALFTRIAFRFVLLYFTLYTLTTQIITGLIPVWNIDIPDPATVWPLLNLQLWTATHLFHPTATPVYQGSGSGDKYVDLALVINILAVTTIATAIWSYLDRHARQSPIYPRLYAWFRLFLRFSLASQMFGYGLAKAIPLQMPYPSLTRLIQPFGTFSPMGVIWTSVGASPSYETFVGCAELLGGLFLILPRTTTLGALICLADMIQVFAINLTYDVPVKFLSFHLVLYSLILLTPEVPRLTRVFFTTGPTPAPPQFPLFGSPRANRIALILQVAFALSLLGIGIASANQEWHEYGGGSPKSPLYGIWNVDELVRDGQPQPPLFTNRQRWRRVIFDRIQSVAFQNPDDTFDRHTAAIDTVKQTLTVTDSEDKTWKANLTYQHPTPTQLILDGDLSANPQDHHKVHLQLTLQDRNKFLLVNRGFHWIQEYPFNR